MDMKILNSLTQHICFRAHDKIQEICKPLFEIFGINYFRLFRVFSDKSFIFFVSNPEWLHHFYKSDYHTVAWFDSAPPFSFKSNYTVWDLRKQEENVVGIDARKNFNIDHGITIIEKNADHVDFYDFTSPIPSINELYLNHIDVLHRFIFLFKQKAASLLIDAEKQKIIVEQPYANCLETTSITPEMREDFISQTELNRFYINNDVYLTLRELECMSFILKGMSLKEAARELNVSVRTVDSYLQQVKTKLGCFTKSELLRELHKHNLSDIIKMLV